MSIKLDLSSGFKSFFNLKDGVSLRLKEARTRIRFKQSEIAEIGQVSRATQVSYETDVTEPNTAYLRRIQSTGIDIPFVLFGITSDELNGSAVSSKNIDWSLLQQSFEDVEYFCTKHAPTCPSSYRWKLVANVYDALLVAKKNGEDHGLDKHELLNQLWSD